MGDEENTPNNWELVQVGDIADLLRGVSYKKSDASSQPKQNKIPILRGNNIQAGKLITDDLVYVPVERVSSDQMMSTRDVVLTMSSGSADLVGKAALNMDGFHGSFGAFCGVLRAYSAVSEKYLYYFLSSREFKKQVLASSKGTNINNLKRDHILGAGMPLAPSAEQRRIVAKIEELFSELDKGVESLITARAQLKTYRQSLLKAAFEGRLTEQWRRDNADKLETADQLLQRIREEREARHQEQLGEWKVAVENWEAGSREEKRPVRPSKPKYLPPPRMSNQLGLPSGWSLETLGNVTYKIGDVDHKMPNSTERGVPYLSTANLREDGSIDFDGAKKISQSDFERLAAKIKPEKGDIIFPRYGTIGRNCLVVTEQEFLVSYSCAIVKNLSEMAPKYVYYFTLSPWVKKEIDKYAHETTQKNVGIASIGKFEFPLCTLAEQEQIVRQIESGISSLSQLEEELEDSLQRAELLRQSILKRAFEGKLVPQDPDEEPASALLERIRQEQADAPKPKRRQRKARASA